jgi:hypothetical protein
MDAKARVCVYGAQKPPHRLRQLGGKLVPLGCKRARGTLKHTKLSLVGAERQRKTSVGMAGFCFETTKTPEVKLQLRFRRRATHSRLLCLKGSCAA